jgi:hypothetical protein
LKYIVKNKLKMQALTAEMLESGLSSIQKTADGSTYAFSEMCIEE